MVTMLPIISLQKGTAKLYVNGICACVGSLNLPRSIPSKVVSRIGNTIPLANTPRVTGNKSWQLGNTYFLEDSIRYNNTYNTSPTT